MQEWQELRRRREEEDRQKRGLVPAEADVVPTTSNAKKTWTLEGEDSDDEDDAVLVKTEGGSVSRVAAFENGDVVMAELGSDFGGASHSKGFKTLGKRSGSVENAFTPTDIKKEEVEEEEVDPLDAFMNSMAIPEVCSKFPQWWCRFILVHYILNWLL